MTITVVIADDQPVIAEGFRAILERDNGIEVAGTASDGRQAIDLVRRLRPDVVIMDIRMPGLDGIAATRQLIQTPSPSTTKVLVVTTYDLDSNVFEALRAGASGFLLKDTDPDDLRRAVHVVAAGEALLAPSVTRRLIAQFVANPHPRVSHDPKLARLTAREREIVTLVAEGLSNADIAARLFISPATAKTHVTRAMLKLDVHDRAQLVVFAYDAGIVGNG